MSPRPRHRFSFRLLLAGLGIACVLPSVRAQLTIDGASSLFLSAGGGSYARDNVSDVHASRLMIDLVGDAARPVFFSAETNDTVYFRLRLNLPVTSGSGAPGIFDQVAAIGIDIDGNNKADIAFAVTGKNGSGVSDGQSYFMAFGESLAGSPSSTGWGSAYGAQNWVTSGAGADFNYSLVSSIDGAVGDILGSAGPNTFLTFAVSYSRLQDAIRSLGGLYAGYVVDQTSASNFAYSAHTGTQTNAVNVDTLANGQIIPELSTWLFLGAGVLPLLGWQAAEIRRRRRMQPVVVSR